MSLAAKNAGEILRKRIIIRGGRVHDVGYRPFLLGVAESLEIGRFYADNIFVDGLQAVEVLVGDEAGKVDAFLDLVMRRRPEGALVEGIEASPYEGTVMKTEAYYRYLSSTQLAKMAAYGGEMIQKQDETVVGVKGLKEEFRDYRAEFRDYREEFREFAERTDGNFRLISEKYGEISDKLTVILNALVQESKETREMLNETMKSLKDALVKLTSGEKD